MKVSSKLEGLITHTVVIVRQISQSDFARRGLRRRRGWIELAESLCPDERG